MPSADIGLIGLAVMGSNLALNIAEKGYTIAVHNRTQSKTEKFMADHGSEGPITGTGTTEEFVQALERPRTIMTMVKAGPAVDAVMEELAPLLDEGDTIVDGGNSHFRDTQRRDKAMSERARPALCGRETDGGSFVAGQRCERSWDNSAADRRARCGFGRSHGGSLN